MRRAHATTKNTGMEVFYDYGPSLHPDEKQHAGHRLSLWALAKEYGKDIVHSGPLLNSVKLADGEATLTFDHVGGGLKSVDGGPLKFFEIAGIDGEYVEADAKIVGDQVVVSSKLVADPIYVRYLFRKPTPSPEVSLINAAGLPASGFITDNFLPPRP